MRSASFYLLLLLTACGGTDEQARSNDLTTVTIRNSLGTDRKDELVVIERAKLSAADGQLPLLKSGADIPPQQLDDLDGDGRWDELAVLLDVAAEADVVLTVTHTDSSAYPDFPARTGVRLGVLTDGEYRDVTEHVRPKTHKAHDPLYHVEGVSWENDRVGFRNYFDERNGKDIFGKRVPDLVLDTVGLGSGYHELKDWGLDILKVGNSLGAGALGAYVDGKPVRLTGSESATFRLLTRGPVRSVFTLTYRGWPVGEDSVDLIETITVTPGNDYYHSRIEITKSAAGLDLITGIVNLQSDTVYADWGGTDLAAFGTWDRQSYVEDGLGMAVIHPAAARAELKTAPEEGEGITQTFYGVFPNVHERPLQFWFLAGWEGSDEAFSQLSGFRAHVQATVKRLESPLEVEIDAK